MNWVRQKLVLKGERHWAARPPAGAVGEVMRLVPSAVQSAVRMAFEGRSTSGGARPAWLEIASDVRFVGHDGTDQTTLWFEVPRLGDAASGFYEQQELWPTRPNARDTGFDLLADVVSDVASGNADSERFDNPLLRRLGHFDHALNGAFQSLEIVAGAHWQTAPATITRRVIETARKFTNAMPQPQAVRVYGRLDMIRSSTQSFALQLLSGEEVRGIAEGFEIGALSGLFQKTVVVIGRAIYRPSGRLLRIDAAEVSVAADDQEFFSRVPPPKPRLQRRTLVRDTCGKGGVAAIFGKWPGDESEEQLLQALEELD